MIKYYRTLNNVTEIVDGPEKDCWVSMVAPTKSEIDYIALKYNIEDRDDLTAALDEEESSRVSVEDNYNLVLVDIPALEERNNKSRYVTIPLGILMTEDAVITVCLEENAVLDFYKAKGISNTFSTRKRTRFLLQLLYYNAKQYLKCLGFINKESDELEKQLRKSTENPALIDRMELGKSLLYFTTSLKSLTTVLSRIQRTSAIKKYEEDQELLEDVIIENRQALEMAETYSDILNGLMDAYASVISNNMNVLQKFLALATIVLSVPSILFDAYGMNLSSKDLPLAERPLSFVTLVAIAFFLALLVSIFFKKKKMRF